MDRWEERAPESEGINGAKLAEAMAFLTRHCRADGTKEVLVIRNGCIIWKGDKIDRLHNTWSIGKIFASTVLGLLIDAGKCSIDDPALDYEPRLATWYPGVTLRHLASFTSGYDGVGGAKWGGYMDGSATPWLPAPPLFAPGSAYLYWDDAAHIFGLVLTKIGQASLYDQFKQGIADPIGMDPKQWNWTVWGSIDGFTYNTGCGFVNISARQLARVGHLFLNGGNWNGQQLISEDWVRIATSPQVSASIPLYRDLAPNPDRHTDHFDADGRGIYGYYWWVNGVTADGRRHLPDAPLGTFYRTGARHNMMFVIPEWRMVIVRLGIDGDPPDRTGLWDTTLKKIGESIIE